MTHLFETTTVLDTPYAELDYDQATSIICQWSEGLEPKAVVVAPVSSLMMRRANRELDQAFENADMIASDGVPIVWMRRLLGRKHPTRVYGPDLMLSICQSCAESSIRVGLLGGHPERMESLIHALCKRFPRLDISMAQSPPFCELSNSQIEQFGREQRASGCRVLFVGMGCPKQEILMERLRPHTDAVMIGVGAAFDFIPGHVRQAPVWIQRAGLEWAFRLACEPKRLWRRYATTIPYFIWNGCIQLIEERVSKENSQTEVVS